MFNNFENAGGKCCSWYFVRNKNSNIKKLWWMVFSAIKSHSPIVGQPANPRKLTFAFFFRFFNSFRNFLVFLVWTQWEVGSSTLIFPSALENVGPTGYIHQKLLLKRKNCMKRFLLPTERVFSTTFFTNTIRWIKWRAWIIMARFVLPWRVHHSGCKNCIRSCCLYL